MLTIENFIAEYGLWAVLIGTMIEGELTLLFAGVLAHYGLFSYGEVFLCGTIGGFIGDSLAYVFGHTGKRSVRRFGFMEYAQPRLEKLCQKYGIYSIFLVKYIYGLRTASAVFWGFAQMGFKRFGPLTLASCMVWVGLLTGGGYFFSEAIELVIGRVQRLGLMLLVAFAVAVLVAGVVLIIERFWISHNIPELGVLGLREPRQVPIEMIESPLVSKPRTGDYRKKSRPA